MRAPSLLGSYVASSLLGIAIAQAPEYSSSINALGSSQSSGLANTDGTVDGATLSSDNEPTCFREGTTTVFVTMEPTSITTFPEGSQPSGDLDSDPQTGEAVSITLGPTSTILFTADLPTATADGLTSSEAFDPNSSSASDLSGDALTFIPSVKPFTTLTIDIWGTGSGPGSDPRTSNSIVSASNSAPQYTSHATVPVDPSEEDASKSAIVYTPPFDPSGMNPSLTLSFGGPSDLTLNPSLPATIIPAQSSEASGLIPPAYTSLAGFDTQMSNALPVSATGAQFPGAESPWYTIVTDTNVNWVNGPAGPTQVTIISPHTLSFSGGVPMSSDGASDYGDSHHTSITVIGSDGQPTVLVPWTSYSGLEPQQTPTSGSVETGGQVVPSFSSTAVIMTAPTPTAQVDGSVIAPYATSCTSFTITGSDGNSTVLHYTWTAPEGSPQSPNPLSLSEHGVTDSSGFPTGIPNDAMSGNNPNPRDPTCLTFTFTGLDGIATIIETTLGADPSGPTPGLPPGFPSGQDFSAILPEEPGVTIFTIIGSDGLPSLVTSTVLADPTAHRPGMPADPPIVSGGSVGLPDASASATCTTFTLLGADGLPTVVETTYWAFPTAPQSSTGAVAALPTPPITGGADSGTPLITSAALPTAWSDLWNSPAGVSSGLVSDGITTCSTFTILGQNGLPTVTESTFVIPRPSDALTWLPWQVPGFPEALPSGFSWPIQSTTGDMSNYPGGSDGADNGASTTCATFTFIGQDGLPTIISSTWLVSQPLGTEAAPWFPTIAAASTSEALGQPTNLPGLPGQHSAQAPGTTTCTSYTLLGADGLPTIVEATWTVPLPTSTGLGLPSLVPQQTGLPQGIPPNNNAITTSFTAITIGLDGMPTPIIQTIIFTPDTWASATPVMTDSTMNTMPGPVIIDSLIPMPSGYGSGNPASNPMITDAGVLPVSGSLPPFVTGTWTGTRTSTLTLTTNPFDVAPGAPPTGIPSYGDSLGNGFPLPGPMLPSTPFSSIYPTVVTLYPSTIAYGSPSPSILRTSTWTNIIAEPTTTYTLNYPLTTLATAKRHLRRQQGPFESSMSWLNSSTPITQTPSPTTSSTSTATMCAEGGKIGNITLDFDDIVPGPLYNPADDFWFSQGFSVVPPSSRSLVFVPSSGGQFLEFVPPSLSSAAGEGSGDTAEIGVGLNFAKSCFRFNMYSVSLGCDAESMEQWCEFDISAYASAESLGGAQSLAFSETKRIPICPQYPVGPCPLTPVEFEGYTNITSILITLRVGLDLRVWWGDDLRVGWTDNSCEAANCRADALTYINKREVLGKTLRRRLWDSLRLV